jgi:hypothetical protein
MNHSTSEDRRYLYDIEWQLMREFSDLDFSFHLIEREDVPLDDLLTLDPSIAIVTYSAHA